MRFVLAFLFGVGLTSGLQAAVAIIEEGQPRAAIFVSERVWDDAAKNPEQDGIWRTLDKEQTRRRLRESVRDFAEVLQRVSGAKVEIVVGAPGAGDQRLPILIGELATAKFGPPAKKLPYEQGLRIVVTPQAIGVGGESDLATSYGLYTLLDQLGCRWFMPSSMGEVLPALKTVSLTEQDLSTGPYTVYRGIWYCDNAFARRNRLGGMELSAGHNLEGCVPEELRKTHPEIRAIINGQPHPRLVKWTHPLVADAVTKTVLDALEKTPNLNSFSLSPDDGASWDDSDDKKFDAGDFDPAIQTVSKTDRLMVLANRVAERVSAKYPNLKFGILAYVDYTRPPVREKLHPNIIPQIAPITFTRNHSLSDPNVPNNAELRFLVEGWGKAVPATSYYFYAYNLAEVASPHPMLTKWGQDVPYVYEKGACRYWQPETLPNFETTLHAQYLGIRLAWDPAQKSADVFDEVNKKFYGSVAPQMAQYWQLVDEAWVKTPEYSGCGFGHLRRFTPERMERLNHALSQAVAAAQTPVERERVQLAVDSFSHFQRFIQLRRDLAEGRFAGLADATKAYLQLIQELGTKYQPQFCFARMGWTGEQTLNGLYFNAFYKATYDDAARVAKEFDILTPSPLRTWKIQADKEKAGEAAGWMKPEFNDAEWKTTDVGIDTWSTIGLHNHMGAAWYRTTVKLPDANGKPTKLWIGSTDGRVKVFVNGRHVPYIDPAGKVEDSFSGFCQPASFDVTPALKAGDNQISLYCTREFLNELGTGGLLAPPVVYRAK